MAKIAMLQMVADCCRAENFVNVAISDLGLVEMGGRKLPFFPSVLFQGHTLEIFREGRRLHCGG